MSDPGHADAIVFFGATGDLAYKQIFPALYALVRRHGTTLPIIGVARSDWSLEQFQARARDSVEKHGSIDSAAFAKLASLLNYVDGDYRDPQTFSRLRAALGQARRPLHYLAIPPSMFPVVVEGLAKANCTSGARVVVEKPFGRDAASSRALNTTLHRFFDESAIFRIDHFLGKEAVQNILYTRFANLILEPIWNRDYVRSVQISLAETFGVEGRGRFYEETGAIRDVIQNHLLQVLACLAMDPPAGGEADALRDEKSRLLKAVRPLTPDDVVRGQFNGYRQEPGVAPDSQVETFAAVRLAIESWRWAGVPFYIRSGKRLPVSADEVVVEFKRPPRQTFQDHAAATPNRLVLRMSPDVVIALGLRVKVPGERMVGEPVQLVATHQQPDEMTPYERLLGDALRGDPTLFARQDSIEAQWRIVDPVLGSATPVHPYAPGTWGPPEADQLVGADGGWSNPAGNVKSPS